VRVRHIGAVWRERYVMGCDPSIPFTTMETIWWRSM